MADTADANRALITELWERLYRHEFDAFFTEDGVYTEVPVGEDGARGPAQVAARLRLGLERVDRNVHHIRHIVCEGDVVVTSTSKSGSGRRASTSRCRSCR